MKKSQCEIIKERLEAGDVLTTWDVYQNHNITTLAQRIADLKHRGMTIHSRLKHNKETGKQYSEYWI